MMVALGFLGGLALLLAGMLAFALLSIAAYDEENKRLKKSLDEQMGANITFVEQRDRAYDQLSISRSVLGDIKDLLGEYYRGEGRSGTDSAAEGE